jgi:hypothetical protein
MPAEKTAQVMVRMSPELLGELRRRADDEERSVAQTVRLAIRSYLSGQPAALGAAPRTQEQDR